MIDLSIEGWDKKAIEDINNGLDEYDNQMAGLPKWSKIDAPSYLTMDLDQLRKKSPDELSEALIQLGQYALNVQRLINRNRSWERWGKAKLDQLTAHYLPEVGSNFGFNERILLARNNPEYCKRINAFLVKVQMRLDDLDQLPYHIKLISDSIKDLKFLAIRREKESFNHE